MDYVLLKLAHITLAAIWIGAGIGFPLDIRATVARGPPHTGVLRERVARVTRIAVPAALLTVLTGVGLVLSAGGFSSVSPRFLWAFAPVTAGFLTGGGFVEPTLRALWKAIETDDRAAQVRLARRFTVGVSVEHVFRATSLALMVVPF
ncbi:MAG TPA: hypothetical protein VIG99_24640 [Myxococcaceae bacterium]|jgi:hypothetical protein